MALVRLTKLNKAAKSYLSWACKAFASDRRGQVAITVAMASIPLCIIAGSAIDLGRAVTTKSNLQQATDATVLAIAHSYLSTTSTSTTLYTPTQTYLTAAMNSAAPSTSTVTYNGYTGTLYAPTLNQITLSNNNSQICISTFMIIATSMMQIMNRSYMEVDAKACSQAADTNEIALALDNSGSMAESAGGVTKMSALQSAAAQLVKILIPSTSITTTSISVVPFTALVNVGTSTSASFLDTAGAASLHWQNFHRPAKASFLPSSKFSLYAQLTNASWGGCVEERAAPYITTDTAASSGTPDTLFVPFFAPDDPGATNTTGSYECYPTSSCGGTIDTSTASGHNHAYTNSYLSDSGASSAGSYCPTSTTATSGNSLYYQWDISSSKQTDGVATLYPGAGATMLCKYALATVEYSGSSGSPTGPNAGCPATKIQPLNNSADVTTSTLNSMVAAGSTNLASGFMWAWRTISPVVQPFPITSPSTIGQQNAKSYTQTSPLNHKYIILMTDGFNSWGLQTSGSNPLYFNNFTPNQSDYEGFGYFANGRLSAYYSSCGVTATTQSSYRCLMDAATLEACNNARSSGVVVYTIGFSVSSDPIDTAGLSLLKSCAYDVNHYYSASDSTSINTAFQQIAQSILSLRLSQ